MITILIIGMQVRRLLLSMTIGAVVLAACGSGGGGARERDTLQIVATTTILGDVVRHITDSDAEVTTLVPIGADPHDYTPSARQVAAIQDADLVVANGLGLEEGLDDVLDAAERDGARVLRLAPLLDPLPFSDPGSHSGHDDENADPDEDGDPADHEDEGHGDLDPHVWLDPVRMADGAVLIGQALAEIDAEVAWVARAETHARRLTAVDGAIAETLSVVPSNRRKLVTNHDALGYFAARYDFEVVGVVVPGGSTLAEPSSAALAELVATIRTEGVPAIFAETTEPAALAEAVAGEVDGDVAVVELYTGSLGGVDSGAATYVGMMLTNAERIAAALQ